MAKNLPAKAEDARDTDSISGSRRCPWSRKWQPTPVFLPEKLHGQRSLVGCSLWSCTESDITEQLGTHIPDGLKQIPGGKADLGSEMGLM